MKLAVLLVAGCSVLSGCVAYETPYRDASPRYNTSRQYDGDHDGVANRYDRDRDGDGVPNNRDARPDNPRRY